MLLLKHVTAASQHSMRLIKPSGDAIYTIVLYLYTYKLKYQYMVSKESIG
jgi:hypothetical protein